MSDTAVLIKVNKLVDFSKQSFSRSKLKIIRISEDKLKRIMVCPFIKLILRVLPRANRTL